jgi:anti-sigma regulatory factor (Ser/Thr protein kinase)
MAGTIWRLFLATPEAVPAARRALDELDDVDESTRSVVELLTSELVTNAVRHGATDPHESILLSARSVDDDGVRVEVCDEGLTAFDADPEGTALMEPGGNGLVLVDALATRWGVDHDHGQPKCVWFEAEAAAA